MTFAWQTSQVLAGVQAANPHLCRFCGSAVFGIAVTTSNSHVAILQFCNIAVLAIAVMAGKAGYHLRNSSNVGT